MHKLSSGTSELVSVLNESSGNRLVQRCLEELRALSSGEAGYQVGVAEGEITYEQLNAVVESLALEHSYYQ